MARLRWLCLRCATRLVKCLSALLLEEATHPNYVLVEVEDALITQSGVKGHGNGKVAFAL